ncbi:MAG TPA: insulinase family protein [Thermoanaerobaculales bacterium]|nr:insulinase family protein [Thermoanaerobaculales bacterium]HQL29457.1 insulinase family protein [Thermoanaerobaculales bacterium]HQN95102.1 insulinase family protein [Thermoanaerobaculales bacterium]
MKLAPHPIAFVLVLAASLAGCGSSQAPAHATVAPAAPAPVVELADGALPLDPAVVAGRLPNGLSYYLRSHGEPRDRAELRLAVNAGSILEDDDQRGLAHFVEHMAFNGTESFARQELVDYLESIGMRFGADVNAYTSFDETVYMLTVPTDDPELLATAVEILSEWAARISFEGDEIDKERGVLIEEWRLGRGARARIFDRQAPVIFHGSRYAERLTIGDKETLESAPHDALRRFYRDWYRPDLMAVVAVGDFDPARVEELIRSRFAAIPPASGARPRVAYPVPDHDATLTTIVTDPEATTTMVRVLHKLPKEELVTEQDYRRSLVENLYDGMLNRRLQERTREADPPFLMAFGGSGNLVREKGSYSLIEVVDEGGLDRGLEALLTEAERVRRHGFEPTELEREKAAYLRAMEQSYRERDKVPSAALADEYVRLFLEREAAPGIAFELALVREHLPGITLAEVNALSRRLLAGSSRVVAVSAPEKAGLAPPDEAAIATVLARVEAADIAPYRDLVADQPLMAAPPPPVEIVAEGAIEEIGVTDWRLANGVRVVLKPTDFRNDEVLFSAFSPGGTSLVEDRDWVAAATAGAVILEGGVGPFDLTVLQKMLADKVVAVGPTISELEEGLSGRASPEDLETALQLVSLYFTEPRPSAQAFASVRERYRGMVENRLAQPEAEFSDTVTRLLTQDHPRRRPWTKELLEQMDLETSARVYRDRFADASDFTFVFVGSFSLDEIRPLVQRYLGNLPSTGRRESWRDVGVGAPDGVTEQVVARGIEPKSRVSITFPHDFEWSRANRFELLSVADVLRIRLRELIREDEGGSYGISVRASAERVPRQTASLTVSFGCDPERVDELKALVYEEIRFLQTDGPDPGHVAKVQQQDRRERELQLRENGFWLARIESSIWNEEDLRLILEDDALVDSLTPESIRAAAARWVDLDRRVEVVLVPAATTVAPEALAS